MGSVALATQRAPETSLPPDGWFLLIGLAAIIELTKVVLPPPLNVKAIFTSMSPVPR